MINENNAKLYCKDDISLIENYDIAVNDKTQIWHCHHRRETIYTREGLIEIGEYYHRPACELIFLTKTEHNKIHKTGNKYFLGKHHTEEYRKNKSKPILQYTKDGELLKEWFGAKEAGRVIGINRGNIVSCCKGKRKSAGGFVWTYA